MCSTNVKLLIYLLFVILLIPSCQHPNSEVSQSNAVRTERLELVDPSGAVRARMEVRDGLTSLTMFSSGGEKALELSADGSKALLECSVGGKTRLQVGVDTEKQSRITLGDSEGKPRIHLYVRDNKQPGISFLDDRGNPRLELELSEGEQNGALSILSPKGVPIVSFGDMGTGTPYFVLGDTNKGSPKITMTIAKGIGPGLQLMGQENSRITLQCGPKGDVSFELTNEKGKRAARVGVSRGAQPYVTLFGQDEGRRAEILVDKDGNPSATLYSKEDKVIWQVP